MKQKMGPWPFKEQRQLIELVTASRSLETIADRLGRPPATILKKAKQLGLSLEDKNAKAK